MVTTRNSARSQKAPVKKKFSDADTSEIEYHTADDIGRSQSNEEEPVIEESESELESDSDDAPEEESTATSKKAILERQKQERQTQQKLKEEEKEARRQRDLKFKQQQEEKKERIDEAKADAEEEELPEFLPEDIFSQLNNSSESTKPQGKHLKATELDALNAKQIRQKIKEDKLRRIQESRSASVKKGPINVKVQSFNVNKKVVPRAEARVLGTKDEWLSRKSLNKK